MFVVVGRSSAPPPFDSRGRHCTNVPYSVLDDWEVARLVDRLNELQHQRILWQPTDSERLPMKNDDDNEPVPEYSNRRKRRFEFGATGNQ